MTACSDNAIINRYDEKISKEEVSCIKLNPTTVSFSKTLQSLYNFKSKCKFTLSILTKESIVCNSSFNIDKKATTQFPSSYVKLVLKKENELLYVYYKDLKHKVTQSDVKKGFLRVKSDLKLK